MDFSGWEKLSLVDYDDNITTTLFTSGCNFKCPFCHNGDLVLHPGETIKIPFEEIKEYLRKRQGVLDAVCVSGGEPTLMSDLEEKLTFIKSLNYKVKLDTNGSNPKTMKSLLEKHLVDYIAMDIKNSKEMYGKTIGVANYDLSLIEESVNFLLNSSFDYEFRTTLIDEFHIEKEIEEIGQWIKGAKRYFLQHYIDSENCIQHGLHEVPLEKAKSYSKILKKYIPQVYLRGYDD
ncbi:MAG TPA: anaerobic ribonucleoside-triphosphate reductase activating protein [Firmicutes bacterium]|nr:anaerobic ribonucleoside-triphosphate reductase activating protein [Bacillota bacterium]